MSNIVKSNSLKIELHKDVETPFLELQTNAKREGFQLAIASGYRSYERQLKIWNEKVSGKREILDTNGDPLQRENLSDNELLFAILRWSAIPGFSRHHWGTDFDIFDSAKLPSPDYQIQLTTSEAVEYFDEMHTWLDEIISTSNSFGFFRPFVKDADGVAPERWHISHGPTAKEFEKQLTLESFLTTIENSDLLLKEIILDHSKDIFNRFILSYFAFYSCVSYA